MNRGDISELAEHISGEKRQVAEKSISEHGRCIYCVDLLAEYFENLSQKPVLYSVFEKERP